MSCLIYTIEAKCGKCGEIHLWEKPSLVDVLDGAEIAAGRVPRIGMAAKGGGKQPCGLNMQVIRMDKVISSTHEMDPDWVPAHKRGEA